MTWVKLTTPNGSAVQINNEQCVRIRMPVGGETAAEAKAIVDLANGQSQATRESMDDVLYLLQGKSNS